MKYFIFFILLMQNYWSEAQSWHVLGGGNERSNTSPHPGLLNVSVPLWIISNASPTDIGGNIYAFGDKFVTTRFKFSAPGQARVECRSLLTGALFWTSPLFVPDSKVHAMAFNEDAVYVHDYSDSNQRFYALDPETGQVKWSYPSYTFGPLDSPIFDCNRNPIFNTSLAQFNQNSSLLRSVDKKTGATRWVMQDVVDNLPNKVKAAFGSKLYVITGTSLTPKKLSAVNLETGQIQYYSAAIPGDALQNTGPFIGPEGTIYVIRDGGALNAFEDTGTGFLLKWSYSPLSVSPFSSCAAEATGDVLIMDGGRIKRISQTSGTVMAESALSNLDNASSLMSCSDSIVVLSNRAGKYMGFSYDLQSLKWSTNMSGGNYYAMPNLSKQGIMVMAGAGTTLYAYKNNLQKAPIASFSASRYSIGAGDSIVFSDQSSYQPTSLEWEFEGGTPASSSQQSPVVAYNQEGNYRVRLKAQNALGADTLLKECYITVGPSTNIRTDFVSSDDFYFYPNPAGESFFMGGKSSLAGQKIVLFSAQGKVVFEGVAQQFPYRISLSGLPSGIYQVFYGNEPIPAGKIIKLN